MGIVLSAGNWPFAGAGINGTSNAAAAATAKNGITSFMGETPFPRLAIVADPQRHGNMRLGQLKISPREAIRAQ
jgi:hypothetical protein